MTFESGFSSLSELLYLRVSIGVIHLQLVCFTSVELYWLTRDSYVQEMIGRGLGSPWVLGPRCLVGEIVLIFALCTIDSFSSTKSHCLDKFSTVSSGWTFLISALDSTSHEAVVIASSYTVTF